MTESLSRGDRQDQVIVRLRFTIHRARELPNRTGKYFVTLAGQTNPTDEKPGANAGPEWNKEFLCELNATNPILSINVFRVGRFRKKPELVAIAYPDVASCLPPLTDIFYKDCPLLSPTPPHPPLGEPTIVFSCILEGRELVPATMKEMVQEEDAVSSMNTPGLTTVISPTTSDVAQNIVHILGKIDKLGRVISEIHPYAKVAWTVLNAAQRAVASQMVLDNRIRDLWETVKDILDLVDHFGNLKDEPLYKKTVEAILKQIYEYVLFVRSYADKGFRGRLARDGLSNKTNSAIDNFEKAFQDLRKSLQDRISIGDTKQTYRLVALTKHIGKMVESQRLDSLPGATLPSVGYDKQKTCLAGTRKELLEDIERWIHTSDESKRILWLCGPAGTGKSSVANSVAERMDSLNRLAASFRFDRNQADRTPGVLVGNLCRQVARFNDSLQGAILEALERHGTGWPCATQTEKLLVSPISTAHIIGPIVIVIDALDESGDDEAVAGVTSRKELVLTIIKEFVNLPPSVKLLITSREEGCIPAFMSSVCKRLSIVKTSNVEDDIKAFIVQRMDQIRDLHGRKRGWPGDKSIQGLIQYAKELFICAAVACNFIDDGLNPDSRLKQVLEPSRPAQLPDLDKLYLTVVEHSLQGRVSDKEAELERVDWRRVMGSIAVVRIPLTVDELDSLLQLPTDSLQTTCDVIGRMLPLLKVDAEKKAGVQLLHKSVFDFLTTRKTDSQAVWYSIDIPVWHQSLAIDCLAYMNEHLTLDMDWISPSEPSSPPPELCNASALRYACRHFADHLSLALDPASCANELEIFLTTHLLHWFEVMARLKEIYRAEESMKLLSDSLTVKSPPEKEGNREDAMIDDILKILREGISFLRTFRVVALLSPPDIYRSGIPMSPKDSRIHQLYSGTRLPRVVSSAHLRSKSLCVFEGHSADVTCVVFSRDGKIASGSFDGTVRLWDAEKGKAISALRHHGRIRSVEFSRDGKRVASGSSDGTVQLWDAEKGEAIGSALEGNRMGAMSLLFSPDEKKVASGSFGGTVRLWDGEKGEGIGSALDGHLLGVTSVGFSPDGKKVASGSFDGTVRLWDAEKGEAIGSALQGHRRGVRSVVFSPDGKKVASGSYDGTMQLWDAEKAEAIGSALKGNRMGAMSVVFSPDGKKVASGYSDGTVRLWDGEKGEAIGSVLEGHRLGVTSVEFSPDAKRVASGSYDGTVRLWDGEKEEGIGSALQGHRDRVTSVVFSPDGKKVASGSYDGTVQLWDSEKGKGIGSALQGHRWGVRSAVFSPDGKKVACGSEDGTVRLWDAEKGEAIGSALEGHCLGVTSVVFSPDGKKVASGSYDRTVRLWDAEKGDAIGSALEGHRDRVLSVVFSPDGKKVASGSFDGTVRLWDVEKGSALEGHHTGVMSVVFSPDGKNIGSVSDDGTLQLWNTTRPCHRSAHSDCDLVDLDSSLVHSNNTTIQPHNVPISHSRPIIDEMGFLVSHPGPQVIWIPPHLRGRTIAHRSNTFVIGGNSGAVTFIYVT